MGSDRKLIDRFLRLETDITVDDCHTLLTMFGYALRKSSGSHRVYHKKAARAITVPLPHGTKYVKTLYVKRIVKILALGEE